MPRYARTIRCGEIVHVISRFVDKRFHFTDRATRDLYIAGLKKRRDDATLLAFALMSSHVHWVVIAGQQPLAKLLQPLHTRFALLYNQRCGGLGPVFAERYRASRFSGELLLPLIAYVHNNPVRAGVVHSAAQSPWTSHAMICGTAAAPPWLDAKKALALCGFDDDENGRASFDAAVCSHADRTDDHWNVSALDLRRRVRRRIRNAELGASLIEAERKTHVLVAPAAAQNLSLLEPEPFVSAAAQALRLETSLLRSPTRIRHVVAARRACFHVWTAIRGERPSALARAMRLPSSTVSRYLSEPLDAEAQDAVQCLLESNRPGL